MQQAVKTEATVKTEVKRLHKESYDAHKTGEVMRDAFFEAPHFTFVLPDPEKRRRALSWFLGTFVANLGFDQGKVYGTQDTKGQAVWLSPESQVGFLASLRAGFLATPFRFGWDGFMRSATLGKSVETLRRDTAPKNHWYLMALGVAPAAQGQGIGSALLRPLLKQVDKEQTPCYLETFSKRNLAFYAKHGFEVTQEAKVENGPVFWGMARASEGGVAR